MPVTRTITRNKVVKKWCFTVNNPEADEEGEVAIPFAFNETSMKYLVYQLEEGEEGTPHWQGFVWMEKRRSLLQMKALNARAHWEVAKGTAKQNRHYCMKPMVGCNCHHCEGATRLTAPVEYGTPGVEDKAGLMAQLVAFAKDDLTYMAAVELEPRLAGHSRAWKTYTEALNAKRGNKWRDVNVRVFFGPPGTGKTRKAVTEEGGYEDVYILTKLNRGATWFDGYEGQKTLVIDDFDSQWSIPYRGLLRLLDGHPVRLPVKGAFTYALFTQVIITTNEPVASWYRERAEIEALQRRISSTLVFPLAGLDQWVARGVPREEGEEEGEEEGFGEFSPNPQVGGNTEPRSSAPHFCHRSSTSGVTSTLIPTTPDVVSLSSSDTEEAQVPMLVRRDALVIGRGRGGRRGREVSFLDTEAGHSGAESGEESDGSVGSIVEFINDFSDDE